MSKDRRYYPLFALGAALVLALAVACGSAEPEVILSSWLLEPT
jgi:hypothetical protein